MPTNYAVTYEGGRVAAFNDINEAKKFQKKHDGSLTEVTHQPDGSVVIRDPQRERKKAGVF